MVRPGWLVVSQLQKERGPLMSFLSKVTGTINYVWKGESCRRDLQGGMTERDLVTKYGEYTLDKVKKSLVK
jgi:hypothetical protein